MKSIPTILWEEQKSTTCKPALLLQKLAKQSCYCKTNKCKNLSSKIGKSNKIKAENTIGLDSEDQQQHPPVSLPPHCLFFGDNSPALETLTTTTTTGGDS